jgi:RimJ/RimL family protein N-acetyltransferase
MRTYCFEPTPMWEHALTYSDCPCHLLLVVCDGQYIVGWCRMFPTHTPGEADVGIGLLLPYRDQGLGTSTLRQAVGWARGQNLAQLTLTARLDNHRAIHVFEKCGFSPVGRSNGIRIKMRRTLQNVETRSLADD